jgi:hypothetical protein
MFKVKTAVIKMYKFFRISNITLKKYHPDQNIFSPQIKLVLDMRGVKWFQVYLHTRNYSSHPLFILSVSDPKKYFTQLLLTKLSILYVW